MSEVASIISQFIQTSPPGSNRVLVKDIETLLNKENGTKLIDSKLREFYTNELTIDDDKSGDLKLIELNDGFSLVSKYNLDDKGLKFIDFKQQVKFNFDFYNDKPIDIESIELNNSELESLQKKLDGYVSNHYIDQSVGMVVPKDGNQYQLIIIGERLNDGNFYNGKWVSLFEYNGDNGKIKGLIKVAVHYYEDGNVLLKSSKEFERETTNLDVIEAIGSIEHEFELGLLNEIGELNENKFKGLRRLLPISRNKIQWGKAIGNYKLGRDVVNNNN